MCLTEILLMLITEECLFSRVFGLDVGFSCQGILFRISQEKIYNELQKVWEREMFAETYVPTWVNVQTASSKIQAITFVINASHEHYMPDLDLEEVAERVLLAEGKCGSCHDYVRNTVMYLHKFGLRDTNLEQLLTLIENPKNTDNLGKNNL